jgi:beta-N-acetylhexosaminidase
MKTGKFIIKVIVFSIVIFFASSFIDFNEVNPPEEPEETGPEFIKYQSHWIDSVYNSLSLDEKIGQLFVVAVYPTVGTAHLKSIENILEKYKPGGLMFSKGGPVKQARLTNKFQSLSKTPLLISLDAEWGPAMRLDSVPSFPRQMMMGAIQNDKVLFDFGQEVGRQCNRLGVHINFAPVIDINNNPKNPVINSRSFGEERINVARKGFAYMFGMQEKRVIATAKHFPGHGDTDSDSHYTLPVINHSYQRLDSIELFPFKYLIDNGLAAVMVAHLHIPALDSTDFIASSLSHKVVTGLLKEDLQFKGLVFTDALGMKGVSAYHTQGEIAVQAFMAGSDMLLMPSNLGEAVDGIKTALQEGKITEEQINERCYKILQAKKWAGLDKYKPVELKNLVEDLNSSEAELVQRKIVEGAITLVENKDNILPFKHLDSLKIASVSIGSGYQTTFQKTLSLYDDVTHFSIHKMASVNEFKALISKLTKFDVVVLGFHKPSYSPTAFGLTGQSVWFAHELSKYTKVVIDVFSSPYSLSKFNRKKFVGIVMSYEDTNLSQDLSAQLLYGGIPAVGKLPVSSGEQYPARTGITDEKIRLKYAIPKELNIDELQLKKVDSIVLDAISQGAMPGCQVLAIKDGVVFYNKSFGYHTYDKKRPVTNDDIYDLASLTKITATVPTIMKMTEEGRININSKLSKYIDGLDTTDKKDILVKQVLAHQARLKAWIPFHLSTFDTSAGSKYQLDSEIYSKKQDSIYDLRVFESLYMNHSYIDTMYKQIIESPLRKRNGYRYSDLGFYLFYKIINERFKVYLPEYVENKFYAPLGSTTLCYNPVDKFPKDRIIPTEKDDKFRKHLVQGYVHDYGAAMMGGVGGHAGLFSNANDLAKVMQMYLQKGEYGGQRYFSSTTIDLFTKKAYSKGNNRRALGFDRPGPRKKSPVTRMASSKSFGHSGFTGTLAWVDPKENFVYIFLSNRIYPDIENNKIVTMHVRTKVQEAFYQSFN